jgi:predicted phosphohydrolase
MRIQFCSDLHLEFPENAAFLKANPLEVLGEVLIIAGDLVPFSQLDEHLTLIELMCKPFQQVYWLPGNHEYYYYNIQQRSGTLQEQILPNLTLINNQSVSIKNVELIFSTLWTHISPLKAVNIQHKLSDFYVIKNGAALLDVDHYNHLHLQSLQFIKNALENSQEKTQVVISHHCPTFHHYPPQYAGSPINEAFAVELEEMILDYQPKHWIYGHTHINTPSFKLHNTQLYTNQLGYVRHQQNAYFNRMGIIDL